MADAVIERDYELEAKIRKQWEESRNWTPAQWSCAEGRDRHEIEYIRKHPEYFSYMYE